MFNPESSKDISKLNEAMRASYRKLSDFRDSRRDLVKDYVGGCYGQSEREMPVNLLAQMVDVYLMNLAGRNPQVILPTSRRDLMPFVADLEAVVNTQLETMRFDKTLRRWVQEAIFSIGILKCGMVDGEYIELIPGQPQPTQDYFADIVDLDDFVFDTDAYSWDRVTFIGDRYKVDYDQLMAGDYDIRAKQSVKANEDNIDEDDDRTSNIGIENDASNGLTDERLKRTAYVWDICLPEEGLVVTIPHSPNVSAPLKIVEWDGPTIMPYHLLSFSDVPGNIMPLAPAGVVKSLNRSMNAIYRKLINQARRQKTVGLYRMGNEDDVEAVRRAEDGELVGVEHPDVVNEVNFGGANPENIGFSLQIYDNFSRQAGNLDAMGGLGPQSETFRQDALIHATVSQKAAKMQVAVVDATVEVIKDMIYRIWNDPITTYTARRSIAGTDVEVAVELPPGYREGTFDDFDIKIEPYSMQYRSPRDRSNELVQLMTNLVFPMMPFMQQQGIGVNIQRLMEYLSKYMTLPELNDILEFVGTPMPGSSQDASSSPQVSHRTYERVNRPGATREGNSRTMQQLLAGGNPQQSQLSSLSRPTGI